ncbi:hypothetical protein [Antarcticirhabdus aurantiaca]|uniref:Uncharacterized protein n=1 Tax=Antarcticirhabdus aurantiaca TaxID=2606717 RepID=A0ACD4NTL3_9HYPH|nr:hypothetical protein [Antarcticirhabdus aurantiaca]WAJ30370.1 hypothetical protein OXU80_09265 [Jeongeuplla avenae]
MSRFVGCDARTVHGAEARVSAIQGMALGLSISLLLWNAIFLLIFG